MDVQAFFSLHIPVGINKMGDFAFAFCPDLKSVSIPSSLTTLGECPFTGSTSLTSISVNSENPVYDSHGQCNAIIETLSNTLVVGCRNSDIPSVVSKIGNHAFSACKGLASVRLHEGIKSIGERAFSDCPDLKSVILPSSLASMGDMAFSDCKQLATVEVRMRQPVSIDENTFLNSPKTRLVVPRGRKQAYESANFWNDFSEVEERR